MFSLSLRRPFGSVPRGLVDFDDPWAQPAMDLEFPMMIRQLQDLSNGFYGETGAGLAASESKDKFDMKLAMRNFRPEDIKVKVQGDNVVVEAKREEKQEEEGSYSYSFREVKRSYAIPEGVDKKQLSCAFTKDGILEIEAPMLPGIEKPPEKMAIDVVHDKD